MSLTRHQRKARQRQRSSLRKDDLPRTPSGALSRSSERYRAEAEMTQKEATIVVMQARQRVYCLNADAAARAEAGSSIGRLWMAGKLSARLYEAAKRFDEDVFRYHRLSGVPHPSPRAMDMSRVLGMSVRSDRDAEIRATSRYMALITLIGHVDRPGKPVWTTLRSCIVLDEPSDNWPPHMVKFLVRGLTALADDYGIPEDVGDVALDLRRKSVQV